MTLNTTLMFGKASDEWSTPQDFFDDLDAKYGFGIDAAARLGNTKLDCFFGPDHPNPLCRDALVPSWYEVARANGVDPICWLNPPYSKCRAFVAKAREAALEGCVVVMLLPARTDTRWWHEWIYYGDGMWWPGVEVRFIKGRLKFGDSNNSAPFPSVVVVFRGLGVPA